MTMTDANSYIFSLVTALYLDFCLYLLLDDEFIMTERMNTTQ